MHSGTGGIVVRSDVRSASVPLCVQNGNNSDSTRSQRFVELIVPIYMYSGATSVSVSSKILSDRGCRGAAEVGTGGTLTFFSMSKAELLVPLSKRTSEPGSWPLRGFALRRRLSQHPLVTLCGANVPKKQCMTSAAARVIQGAQAVH